MVRLRTLPEHWWGINSRETLETPIPYGYPYAIKRHGLLVHRVRNRSAIIKHGRLDHVSVDIWCGGGYIREDVTYSGEPSVAAEPAPGRLICAACERRAVEAGEKSSDEILGRHVHTGRTVVRQICHAEQRGRN